MERFVEGLKKVQLVVVLRYPVLVEQLLSHGRVNFLLVEKCVWDDALVVDSHRPQLLLLLTREDSKGVIINDLWGANVF